MGRKSYEWGRSQGCPCGGCADRHVGCHSGCERYREWRKIVDRRREAEQLEKRKNDLMSEDQKRAVWRNTRYSVQNMHRRGGHND